MKFIAKIRSKATNVISNYEHSFEGIELAQYAWSKGNYSDNNTRSILFSWCNLGRHTQDQFDVRLLNENGQSVYAEFEE